MKKLFIFTLMLVCSIGMYATKYSSSSFYLVGDATPIGWEGDENMRQPCRMFEELRLNDDFFHDYSPTGVYVWTGLLRHGGEGFKICTGGGWDGYSFHPSSEGLAIGGDANSSGIDTYTTSGNDWKWNPTNTDWQWYRITLDSNNGTLKWELLSDYTPIQAVDGVISIGSASDLLRFAELLRNNVNGESYNVKLTADIDYYESYDSYNHGGMYSLGLTEKMPFKGEFDGQGHTVNICLSIYNSRSSLFGTVQGKVHDLRVAGSYYSYRCNQTGGICGLLKGNGSKIYNCISEVSIHDEGEGDGTIGGICAVAYDAVSIENCAFYGSIYASKRDSNGCILGWANSGTSTTIKNCLVVPYLLDWAGGEDFGRNNPSVVNSYKTDEQDETLANGQMTYKLNNYVSGSTDWYQTLGTDARPTPLYTSAKLYANGTFYCDGITPKEGGVVLSNTDEAVVDPHVFGENGICTVCYNGVQEPDLIDGFYQIKNQGNLLWWAYFVNAGNTESNAKLTKDLDMTHIVHTPIGTNENCFAGTFDGQGYSVTFNISQPDKDYQGLFGVATDGATIKNVIVKGAIEGKSYVAGIVGGSNGGTEGKTLNILNCGNEAQITAQDRNGGGIIGVNMLNAAHFFIKDCYNVGNVSSARESGAITGWTGGNVTTIQNTYNIGTVTNGEGDGFIRGGGNLINTYNLSASDEMVTSGKLCTKLGYAFRQNIGEDAYPVLDKMHGMVKEITEVGYATMYAPYAGKIPEGVSAFTGENKGTWLKLNRIEEVVPANEPVVLKGDAGFYNFMPAEKTLKISDFSSSSYGEGVYGMIAEDVKITFYAKETWMGYGNIMVLSNSIFFNFPRMNISAGGMIITKIVFEAGDVNCIGSNEAGYNAGVWTGRATSLDFYPNGGTFIYSITVTYIDDPANIEGNELKGTAEDIDAAGKFILAKPDGEEVGFYLAETGTIAAGKAYLESSAGVKAIYFEGDDATGLEANGQWSMVNGQSIYNLSGQRLSKMQKGINIVNGKKTLVR